MPLIVAISISLATFAHEKLLEYEILTLSVLVPFLVVISITPAAALDPYIEEDAASFKTLIDSMSSGFTNEILGISTLSSNINGVDLAVELIDAICPRIRITGSEPTSPLGTVIDKPGTEPCNPRPTSAIGRLSNVLFTSTVATAPVKFFFCCDP